MEGSGAKLTLRIKTRSGRFVINNLRSRSTLADLQTSIQDNAKVDTHSQKILLGYPPKELALSNVHLSLTELGIKSGETLIVEEQSGRKPVSSNRLAPRDKHQDEKIARKIVPADNSCLFTSISLLLSNSSVSAQELRELVGGIILSDPEKFSSAMLGRENDQYTEWIMKEESWGGAIELSILSEHYETELHVVDIQTNRIDKFGQNNEFCSKALLIYDGIHYDPLVCQTRSGQVTMFTVNDDTVTAQALALATEAQKARQFTDVTHFSLRCLACGKQLVGQKDAQSHAELTQHTNFGEI